MFAVDVTAYTNNNLHTWTLHESDICFGMACIGLSIGISFWLAYRIGRTLAFKHIVELLKKGQM